MSNTWFYQVTVTGRNVKHIVPLGATKTFSNHTHTHSCCSSSVDWYLHTVQLDHPPSSTSVCLFSHISPTHISHLKRPIFLVKFKQREPSPIKFLILWPRYYLAVALNDSNQCVIVPAVWLWTSELFQHWCNAMLSLIS